MVFPETMSHEAKDLIDKLLNLNPEERLGCGPLGTSNDFSAIKEHKFFDGFDFTSTTSMKVPIPDSFKTQRKQTVKRVQTFLETTDGQMKPATKEPLKEVKRGVLRKRNEWYI